MQNNDDSSNYLGVKVDKTIFIGAILVLLPFTLPLLFWSEESVSSLNII
ncbi:MAG: hypothetical protein JSW63_00130 [Ignavibacterium sp.]|nr:MAG: hypothetical protein JSW63_00130 [Ignavibacterium sp.]